MSYSGEKVVFDRALGVLYGVETFNLNKAMRWDIDRCPQDVMFQEQADVLRFQIGMSKTEGRGTVEPLFLGKRKITARSSRWTSSSRDNEVLENWIAVISGSRGSVREGSIGRRI
ncbi:MAG: ORF6N domain-containing protein [Thermodesulfovibrionales bacterium]